MWTTEEMDDAVKKYSKEYNPISGMIKIDAWERTEEEQKKKGMGLICTYAPKVFILGYGLRRERHGGWGALKTWGGAYVRVLGNKEKGLKEGERIDFSTKMCLQFLYVYTRQKGVVTFTTNILLPFLLILWGHLVTQWLPMVLQVDNPLFLYSLLMLTLPLLPFGLALIPHYNEFRDEKPFSLRSSTFLPLLLLLMPTFAFFHSILLWGILLVFLVIWLAEKFDYMPTSHPMDYVPVFVYLKRDETNDPWKFDFAIWDRWHYGIGSTKGIFDRIKMVMRESVGQEMERIPLTIDNYWHSMYYGEPKEPNIDFYRLLGGISFLGVLISMLSVDFMLYLTSVTPWGTGVLYVPILCMFFVYSIMTLEKYPTELVELEDFFEENARLDSKKLSILWNLVDKKDVPFWRKIQRRVVMRRLKSEICKLNKEQLDSLSLDIKCDKFDEKRATELLEDIMLPHTRPQLAIIQKFQTPFTKVASYHNYYKSFRDSPEFILPIIEMYYHRKKEVAF